MKARERKEKHSSGSKSESTKLDSSRSMSHLLSLTIAFVFLMAV